MSENASNFKPIWKEEGAKLPLHFDDRLMKALTQYFNFLDFFFVSNNNLNQFKSELKFSHRKGI